MIKWEQIKTDLGKRFHAGAALAGISLCSIPAGELYIRHFVVMLVVGVIDNDLRCWYYIQHESC
jgi:hypothetical protein